MKPFKTAKKKEREIIKIVVVTRLDPPPKVPLKLFKNVHPPKFKKEFYLESQIDEF